VEHAAKYGVDETHIVQCAVEALDGTTVHLLVRAVATVRSNYRRLATVPLAVGRWSTPCFTPVGGQPLGMPRMEAMAEGMRHDLVGHDALMPSVSKTEDTFRASNRFEQGCISHFLLLAERHSAPH
jgi:hypothetical protein